MENDLQIFVKGMDEKFGRDVGEAVAATVRAFKRANEVLDLRRMHRIIIASDFAGELAELSRETASGNAITHTNEEYAIAVAKVLLLPRGEEYEILPVLNANVISVLTQSENPSEEFFWILHLLHHELCHVHEDNKCLDAFPNILLRHRYQGKDRFIRPLAEACWSEYYANRLSSSSAPKSCVKAITESLADAIRRTKTEIDGEILAYRYHSDLEQLLGVFRRHGEFLPRTAAYVLGYIDGLESQLKELSSDAAACLKSSYFEPTWNAMQKTLREMHDLFPHNWKNLSVYDNLATALEAYYNSMGFVLSNTDDGRTYVNVPFRPETTPPFSQMPT